MRVVGASPLVGAIVFSIVAATPAFAFDCGKAASPIEKTTCADPAAVASDQAMSTGFAALKAKLDPAQGKMLLADQRRWLKSRSADFAGEPAGKQGAFVVLANSLRAKALAGQADAGPGLSEPLVPVFVDRPASPKGYDVSVMLYRSGPGRKIEALDRSTAKALADIPTKAEDPHDGETYSFELRDKITYADRSLLSILRSGWRFDGGAHGQSSSEGVNIDLRGGRLFEMSDVLAPQGLKEIATLCRTQLRTQALEKLGEGRDDKTPPTAEQRKEDAQMVAEIEKAAGPLIEDLKSWHFDAAGAVIGLRPIRSRRMSMARSTARSHSRRSRVARRPGSRFHRTRRLDARGVGLYPAKAVRGTKRARVAALARDRRGVQPSTIIDRMRLPSVSMTNGLVITCIPGFRWPCASAAFSA